MKNKFKNMKLVISIIIILIALLLSFIMVKTNVIQKVIENLNKEEETITDGIYCKVYDNTSDKLKSLIIISRVDGIEKIEYLSDNGNGDTISLNCNNKQQVGIDYEVEIGREYNFKVTSNGEEKEEKIILEENYIDDVIRITKLEDKDELSYNEVEINFDLLRNATKQYKVNKGPWVNYNGIIKMDLGDIDKDKLDAGEYDTTIYVRSIDSAGYTLQNSKTIEITKHNDFDVFQSMIVSEKKDLYEYGFGIASWGNTESRWFDVQNIGGGHHTKYTPWSMVAQQNWTSSQYIFSNVEVTFTLWADTQFHNSNVYGGITINYTDGTSNSVNSEGNFAAGTQYKTINANVDINKTVENIQFRMWGYDGDGSSSWGSVRDVYIKGIKKIEMSSPSEIFDSKGQDVNDENYDENKLHIGDFVNYDAGIWTASEIANIKTGKIGSEVSANGTAATPTEDFQFGGFTAGTSRNASATAGMTGVDYIKQKNSSGNLETVTGWRVFDIDGDTITLISAGCPEDYWQYFGNNYGYASEYILTGNIHSSATGLNLNNIYTKRNWSNYVTGKGIDATVLSKNRLDQWYKKYLNGSDCSEQNTMQKIYGTQYETLIDNYCYYYLPSTYVGDSTYYGKIIYAINPEQKYISGAGNYGWGIRVLVTLDSNTKIISKKAGTKDVVSRGTTYTYNVWNIL